MITLAQVEELERSLRFTLQKTQYLKNALIFVEHRQKTTDLGYLLDYAVTDAERQERIFFAVAGELKDELNKLPEPAAPETKVGG